MNTKIVIARTLLKRWGATEYNIHQILSKDDHQLDERISAIIDIHAQLQKALGNPKHINKFMAEPNHKAWWDGRIPLSIIASGKMCDLNDVCSQIHTDLNIH